MISPKSGVEKVYLAVVDGEPDAVDVKAFEKGIVKGDNLGLFGVNAGITREDATAIASRVLKLMGKSTEATRDYGNFADEDIISDYAKEAVRELYCMGRINGTNDGKFEPQRFCTRAEAAMIIYNISR